MMPDDAPERRPSLARELLWNLALLTVAALSLAVATTLFVQSLAPRLALVALVGLIVADVAVLYVFGRHLVRRLVLQPVTSLIAAADAIARGDLETRVPPPDTAELHRLAERINEMTAALQDTQSQLVRAEKLAGIGRLAAGIAHEVGNPLAAISNYVGVLRRREADAAVVADLEQEIQRIDQIVRGLLAYARTDGPEDTVGLVEVGPVIDRAVELLARQGRTRGRVVTVVLDPNLPAVRVRPTLLEQVVVNLLLNALDAAASGAIGIDVAHVAYAPGRTDQARRGDGGDVPPLRRPSRTPLRPDLAPGAPGVLIVVSDEGSGVPRANRERVFDPFVTTKPPGAGTGLGLAVVQRIVHESGGLVWVDDARGGGAAFKVFLPAAGAAAVAGPSPPAGPPAGGGPT